MNTKRLYKSQNDKVISGVCGGIAEYFNVDSTLVRLGFILLLGFNLIFYIVALLVMPERPSGQQPTIDNNGSSYPTAEADYQDRGREYSYYGSDEEDHTDRSPQKLYRSGSNKVIAGVCGGIAEYFNIDASIIRLIVVLLAFAYGGGFIAYLIAWLVIPEQSY